MEKKFVALNYVSHPHYLDHLGPISAVMEMPLLVVEEADYLQCQKCYPDVEVIQVEYNQLNPENLIKYFDVLFMSDLWDRALFYEKFEILEQKYKKKMRNVHVPHGYSDKGFYLRDAAREDITLVYGQNMLDMFKDEGVFGDLNQYVITGNYRYTYYKKHKIFYDALADQEIFHKIDPKKKTILYAPTWVDFEQSSSFFEHFDDILKEIPDRYNVIIKPHPELEYNDTILYYKILGHYENHPNIHFITNFHVIYPILERTDIYLGDMSSIGYDFLAFNRPMFFLNKDNKNPKSDKRSFLFNCGIDIKRNQFPHIREIIDENIDDDAIKFGQIRQDVYHYTFGDEKPFEEIKKEILKSVL